MVGRFSAFSNTIRACNEVTRREGKQLAMATNYDFRDWLGSVEPLSYENVYSLYRSIKDGGTWGLFSTSSSDGRYFVTCEGSADTLALTSAKVKDVFLKVLQDKYCQNGMDIEGWYINKQSMSRL
jgi:hypothetical protein